MDPALLQAEAHPQRHPHRARPGPGGPRLPRRQGCRRLRLGRPPAGGRPRRRTTPATPPSRSSSSPAAISTAQQGGQLTEADAAALTEQLQALDVDVNPRYGTLRPATRRRCSSPRPAWVTAADRGAVTDGRLGLLVTSPRVAPGLLSHGAWEVVAERGGAPRAQPRRPPRRGGRRGRASPSRRSVTRRRRRSPAASSTSRPTVPVVWLGSSDGDPGLADAAGRPRCRASSRPRTSRSSSGRGTCRAGACSTSSRPWTGCAHPAAAPGTPSRPTRASPPTSSRRPTRSSTPSSAGDRGPPRRGARRRAAPGRLPRPGRRGGRRGGASTSTPWPGCSSRSSSAATRTSSPTATRPRPAEVEQAWERIKAEEKASRAGDGGGEATLPTCCTASPTRLPGDLAAEKVLARVRRRGLVATPASLDAVATAPAPTSPRPRSGCARRCADLAAGADRRRRGIAGLRHRACITTATLALFTASDP